MSELLFFKPPNSASRFTRSGSVYPPLGLCQLAAMFPPGTTKIFDAEAEGDNESTAQEKLTVMDPRIAMMTASSFTLPLIERWAAWFKSRGVLVIVGGPHATLRPLDLFTQCPSLDIAIRGEAELVLPRVTTNLLKGESLDGSTCCLRSRAGEVTIGRMHRIHDFSNHPLPDFSGLDLAKYWCPDAARRPMATMMTVRGCKSRCGFCSAPALHGTKVRGWDPSQIVLELKRLNSMGIQEISFLDDGFTTDRDRAMAICQGIQKLEIDLSWFCNARADSLDEDLVDAMKRAGCHQVYMGLESGSEQILHSVNKDLNLTHIRKGAEILRANGVGLSAGFVVGLPGETDSTVWESIRLAKELCPDRIQFSRFIPLPGSPLNNKRSKVSSGDFHTAGEDQVGEWIQNAYRLCKSENWGQPSW